MTKLNTKKPLLLPSPHSGIFTPVRILRILVGLSIILTVLGILLINYPERTSPDAESTTGFDPAAPNAKTLKSIGLSGTISQLDGQTVTIVLNSGREAAFDTTSQTTVVQRIDSQPIVLSSQSSLGLNRLRIGHKVTVLAQMPSLDQLSGYAERIVIENNLTN